MITAEKLNAMYQKPKQPINRLATVTRMENGRPYVRFDGEDSESTKKYATATGLTFAVGDRVFMQQIGGTYIIAYKITP